MFGMKVSLSPPPGQPAAPAAGAASLRPAGQAEPCPVPGPARAAAAGHQHHVASRLVRAAAGRQREREAENAGQVSVVRLRRVGTLSRLRGAL